MIFLGLAGLSVVVAAWLYWLSGAIEEKRQQLKNKRGITRERSAARKTMTVVAKNASYVFGGVAILAAWLHFGLGL